MASDRKELRGTVDALSYAELEQYAYGKYLVPLPKALPQMLALAMSKNPLTAQQIERIARKYGTAAIVHCSPSALALNPRKAEAAND